MKKNLCLFFSNDTSLNDWKNSGVLDREINYYTINFSNKNII